MVRSRELGHLENKCLEKELKGWRYNIIKFDALLYRDLRDQERRPFPYPSFMP